MNKGFQYTLYPNNKQNTRMFQIAGATRYAYNWALDFAMKYFEENHKFISPNDITKEFTKHKRENDNKWLYTIPNNTLKQSVKNAAQTVIDVYMSNKENHTNNEPHFKRKFKAEPTIYLDSNQVKFTKNSVKLDKISLSQRGNRSKLNWVRLSKKHNIPIGLKSYQNPTVKFVDNKWVVSISIELPDSHEPDACIIPENLANDGIGMDLGIKELAVCSNGDIFENINKTPKVRKLEKLHRHRQRKFSKKLEKNKVDDKVVYSKNMIKQKDKTHKLDIRLKNIRNNYIYQSVNKIIKQKPSFISIEDLNIKGMMKNKHLSKAIQNQKLYFFKTVLTYKCDWHDIPLAVIDRWYPSSKKCSCCGNIYKDLKLKNRTYNCSVCGISLDRDYNASINIKNEGFRILKEQYLQAQLSLNN